VRVSILTWQVRTGCAALYGKLGKANRLEGGQDRRVIAWLRNQDTIKRSPAAESGHRGAADMLDLCVGHNGMDRLRQLRKYTRIRRS
jgi:hypothetical protein